MRWNRRQDLSPIFLQFTAAPSAGAGVPVDLSDFESTPAAAAGFPENEGLPALRMPSSVEEVVQMSTQESQVCVHGVPEEHNVANASDGSSAAPWKSEIWPG